VNKLTILLIIAVFMGIIAGYFLSLIAAEEIKPGYSYFVLMQNIVFSILIAVISLYLTQNLIIPVIAAVIIFSVLYWKNIVGNLYIFSGLLLFIVKNSPEYLILSSSLLFILGLPVAGISAYGFVKKLKIKNVEQEIIEKKLDLLKHLALRFIWFIPIALLPFLFSNLQ